MYMFEASAEIVTVIVGWLKFTRHIFALKINQAHYGLIKVCSRLDYATWVSDGWRSQEIIWLVGLHLLDEDGFIDQGSFHW